MEREVHNLKSSSIKYIMHFVLCLHIFHLVTHNPNKTVINPAHNYNTTTPGYTWWSGYTPHVFIPPSVLQTGYTAHVFTPPSVFQTGYTAHHHLYCRLAILHTTICIADWLYCTPPSVFQTPTRCGQTTLTLAASGMLACTFNTGG